MHQPHLAGIQKAPGTKTPAPERWLYLVLFQLVNGWTAFSERLYFIRECYSVKGHSFPQRTAGACARSALTSAPTLLDGVSLRRTANREATSLQVGSWRS